MNTSYKEVSQYYSRRIKNILETLFFSAIEKNIRSSEVNDFTTKPPVREGKMYPSIAEYLDVPATYTSIDNIHYILSTARKDWDIVHYNPLAAIFETMYLSAPAHIPGLEHYNNIFRNTLEYDLLVPHYKGSTDVTAVFIKDSKVVGFNAVTLFEIIKEYGDFIQMLHGSGYYLMLMHHGSNNPLPEDIREKGKPGTGLLNKVRNRVFANFADINAILYAENIDTEKMILPPNYVSVIYGSAADTIARMSNFVHKDIIRTIVIGHTNLLLLLCYLEVLHRGDNRDSEILNLYNQVLGLYDFETDVIGIPELTYRPYPFKDKEIPFANSRPVSNQAMLQLLTERIRYFTENIRIEEYSDKMERQLREDVEVQNRGMMLFRESYMEDLRKGNRPKKGDRVPFNYIDHKKASELSWIVSRNYLDLYVKNISKIYEP